MADRFPDPFPPPFAGAWGDDAHGLWAEFELLSEREGGGVAQRLRWIEPGTFLMGSPADEPGRDYHEGPRHTVTLTRGFWLADSACTQLLWRTVMGTNPSRFTGDEQRPVENVSWDDVQGFLRKLETLVPACEAGLPTEAEWEYACRAGSDTPFSFGAQITPQEVNYDGNYPHADYPYAGGEKGLYRKETVPVKSLPPNAWGLYEIHGNVWEWCADGMRRYDGLAQQDPQGPVLEGPEAPRVQRGGSWFNSAGWARSAYRRAPAGPCRRLPGLSPVPEVHGARSGTGPGRRFRARAPGALTAPGGRGQVRGTPRFPARRRGHRREVSDGRVV